MYQLWESQEKVSLSGKGHFTGSKYGWNEHKVNNLKVCESINKCFVYKEWNIQIENDFLLKRWIKKIQPHLKMIK